MHTGTLQCTIAASPVTPRADSVTPSPPLRHSERSEESLQHHQRFPGRWRSLGMTDSIPSIMRHGA
ncbi:MAG: hypothetical protein Fur005_42820 [Roseiflexaceae bacterium]